MSHRALFLLSLILLGSLFYVSYVVLMPIIVSAIIAYLLLPLKRFLRSYRLTNVQATLVVFIPILAIFVLFLVFMIPLIQEEFWNLLLFLPQYGQMISDRLAHWQAQLDQIDFLKKFSEMKVDLGTFVPDFLQLIKMSVLKLLSSTSFFTDFILYSILIPIFTFYLLKDYEFILGKVSGLVPLQYRAATSSVFKKIDERLINYVGGQFILGVIFTLYYCVFLSIVGLKHGLIIGILTGLFFFIPIFPETNIFSIH